MAEADTRVSEHAPQAVIGGAAHAETAERAETGRIGEALAQIGRSLDEFNTFSHGDAQQHRATWHAALDQPLPQAGIGIDATLRELREVLIPNGGPVARPGFSAYVTTGPTTVAIAASAAQMLAAPQRQLLHAFNFVEERSLEWLAQLHGLPAHMRGVYNSGGSVANLVALGAARQSACEQAGFDPAADGMQRRGLIYASREAHHTIKRAAGVLGIGRANVIPIATDGEGRIDPHQLDQRLRADRAAGTLTIAIVASAGTTNTGAIDPLDAIADVAAAHATWFHVDGAYGLPGILDPRKAPLYAGLERADSVIVDPHKWLGAPVGIGATYVRDRAILARAFTQEPASYLEGSVSDRAAEHTMDSLGIPYADFAVELSSPPRGVVVWGMLKEIGIDGMRARIVRHNDMAARVAERVRSHANLELLAEPTLSICCFRYTAPAIEDHDAFNRALHRRLLAGNKHLPSTTVVNGKLAIRPCFIGARTAFEYADGLVDEVLRIGAEMLRDS